MLCLISYSEIKGKFVRCAYMNIVLGKTKYGGRVVAWIDLKIEHPSSLHIMDL